MSRSGHPELTAVYRGKQFLTRTQLRTQVNSIRMTLIGTRQALGSGEDPFTNLLPIFSRHGIEVAAQGVFRTSRGRLWCLHGKNQGHALGQNLPEIFTCGLVVVRQQDFYRLVSRDESDQL